MKCGFYEMDVTPPLGSIIPGGFAARYAMEVQEPLYVRAFCAEEGDFAVGIVVIDACGITQDITDRIRERVAQFSPIPAENVMVIATHAHGGGPTLNWGEEVVTHPEYLTLLVNRAADSISLAYQKAKESELVRGKEELFGVSFIRVYRMKDGTYKTNPSHKSAEDLDLIDKPYTTIDPEVLVLGVRQEGKLVGAIVNFANHPAIVAKSLISSDYIYYLSKEMKKEFGEDFVTLFINGACGNINHVDPFDPVTYADGRHRVVGEKLAEKAISALSSAVPMEKSGIGVASQKITVQFRKPSAEALLEAQELLQSYGDDLVNRVPRTPKYQGVFFAFQALRAMADKRTQREMELQLMRIGDIYVAATPTQIFTEFGKAIKAGLPGPAFVSAFANDYCGYVPAAFLIGEKNVYEQKLCPTSALEPATGDKVVAGVLELQSRV